MKPAATRSQSYHRISNGRNAIVPSRFADSAEQTNLTTTHMAVHTTRRAYRSTTFWFVDTRR